MRTLTNLAGGVTTTVRAVKEYVAYEAPDGTIIIDWNGNAWRGGIYKPYYRKDQCKEIDRGIIEGGPAVTKLWCRLRQERENRDSQSN